MKKLLVVVLAVAMVVSIAACSKKNKSFVYVTDVNGQKVTDKNGEPVTKDLATTNAGEVIVTNEDGIEVITITPEDIEDDAQESTKASGKGESQTITTQASTKAGDSSESTTNVYGGYEEFETPIIPLN